MNPVERLLTGDSEAGRGSLTSAVGTGRIIYRVEAVDFAMANSVVVRD